MIQYNDFSQFFSHSHQCAYVAISKELTSHKNCLKGRQAENAMGEGEKTGKKKNEGANERETGI